MPIFYVERAQLSAKVEGVIVAFETFKVDFSKVGAVLHEGLKYAEPRSWGIVVAIIWIVVYGTHYESEIVKVWGWLGIPRATE